MYLSKQNRRAVPDEHQKNILNLAEVMSDAYKGREEEFLHRFVVAFATYPRSQQLDFIEALRKCEKHITEINAAMEQGATAWLN